MVQIERWKIIAILIVCFLGIFYTAPNFINSDVRQKIEETMPAWFPSKTINLGLDLQGGVHLLMSVDVDGAISDRIKDLEDNSRRLLRKEKLGFSDISIIDNGILIVPKSETDIDNIKKEARNLDDGIYVSENSDGAIEVIYDESGLKAIKDIVLSKSIEVVRKRVDETGTREPVIQRQGDDRILIQVPGFDDPEYLKELLQRTAKLTFHLVSDRSNASSRKIRMLEDPDSKMSVKRRPILDGSMLITAQPSFQEGSPVVSFKLNSKGAKKFCDVTRRHTGKLFAIVLDDRIVSAPRINEPICGGQAIISGRFTIQEISDLSLLLRAGALPATLTPLEERSIGPSLGADSVEAGKIASIVGMCLILLFMIAVYGRFGFYANVALIVNMCLIFAILSGLQATLTLPGIAGIVLTIGMAVDANVLIFERIREELRNGRSPIGAVDAGYSKAMSTIIDANVTTLIAAILLYSFGTGPIKGFAVTLGVGILTSFFSAIMVTRLMVVLWLRNKKPTQLKI